MLQQICYIPAILRGLSLILDKGVSFKFEIIELHNPY